MYKIIVTTTFGIEAITGKELKNLGYEDLKIENGKKLNNKKKMNNQ